MTIGAFHRDAHPVEHLVVLRAAVVDVDQPPGDVAVGRIGVVGRELFGLLVRGRVGGDGRFDQRGDQARGGAVISSRRDFGVGIRTWNSSISTCHPHCFSRPAIHSALSLSYGDPRWCGRADMRLHVLADLRGVGNGAELRVPALGRRRLSRHGRGKQTQGEQDVRQTHEDSGQQETKRNKRNKEKQEIEEIKRSSVSCFRETCSAPLLIPRSPISCKTTSHSSPGLLCRRPA